MRLPRHASLVALSAVLGACVHNVELQPAPTAQVLPGQKDTAIAEAAGVRVIVDGAPWDGYPSDLGALVIPVRVTLENQSGAPLRIRFREFSLVTTSGFRAFALPPFHLQRPGVALSAPCYPCAGFYVAPLYAPFYPRFTPWPGPFDLDPFYFDTYYYQWREPLPSRDMLEKALPEGVLENGGRVTGYLYFQPLGHGLSEVRFMVELVNAETKAALGTISIPFIVKR
jgi:hypothetical protein